MSCQKKLFLALIFRLDAFIGNAEENSSTLGCCAFILYRECLSDGTVQTRTYVLLGRTYLEHKQQHKNTSAGSTFDRSSGNCCVCVWLDSVKSAIAGHFFVLQRGSFTPLELGGQPDSLLRHTSERLEV